MEGNRILHIVGNRPQFIKLAPLSKELRGRGHRDAILHTGQHYDRDMSDIFFEELGIGRPWRNLGVGSGSHAETTARAMVGVERAARELQPRLAIVYGDTDTTLAAALACRKLGIPIAHVEAGGRTHSPVNPEEVNRVLVDHMSEVCFCSDRQSVENLEAEGLGGRAFFTGDIMYDTFLQAQGGCREGLLEGYGLEEGGYVLMTWHRQENTESKGRMGQILGLLERVPCKVLYPVHPRTEKMLRRFGLWERARGIQNLVMTGPLGYGDMVCLQRRCRVILTDSGGLSKESAFAGVRCLFMLDLDVWPDLRRIGWLRHVEFDEEGVEEALRAIDLARPEKIQVDFYGDGHAAEKIVDILERGGYAQACPQRAGGRL